VGKTRHTLLLARSARPGRSAGGLPEPDGRRIGRRPRVPPAVAKAHTFPPKSSAMGSGCMTISALGAFAKLPPNFPRSEHRDNPTIDVFYVDKLIVDKLIAKGLCFALQMRQHPIPILLVIRLLARVNVGRTIPQHPGDPPGQLLRRRRHRFGRAQPSPPLTILGPQGPVTVGDAWGRQPPGRRRPVG